MNDGPTVVLTEAVVTAYRRRYPALTRERIIQAIVTAGPVRYNVALELDRLAVEAAARGQV